MAGESLRRKQHGAAAGDDASIRLEPGSNGRASREIAASLCSPTVGIVGGPQEFRGLYGWVAGRPAKEKALEKLRSFEGFRWCEGEDLNLHGNNPASTSS